MIIYLDWNILNLIEKKETLDSIEKQTISALEEILRSGKIITPYSNAHLNDLIRGFKKNPNFIEGHLATIERVTKNLCICQYWKNEKTIFHIRNVREFFQAAIDEKEFEPESYENLFDEFDEVSALWGVQKSLLRLQPVPKEFKQVYQADPIFSIIYPRTRNEMNMLALCSDLYNFSLLLHKDYSLYKSLRKFLITTMNNLRQNKQVISGLQKLSVDKPKYLDIEQMFDEIKIDNKSVKNAHYDKVLNTFFKFDIKGYKADGQFSNMIDDSLHTFYASHCDIFLTNDDRCKYKAIKTYERLGITTRVMTAKEFIEEAHATNIGIANSGA